MFLLAVCDELTLTLPITMNTSHLREGKIRAIYAFGFNCAAPVGSWTTRPFFRYTGTATKTTRFGRRTRDSCKKGIHGFWQNGDSRCCSNTFYTKDLQSKLSVICWILAFHSHWRFSVLSLAYHSSTFPICRPKSRSKIGTLQIVTFSICHPWALLLTWISFNPSMDM